MLPRRFALIRHVDYSGGAGTGVIAYGVAFDDGQVVLRWSSAHRATSVLDSVEDLIAAHGHGETTSIEWIDAVPGTAEPAAQQGGRRARRSAPPNDASSTADVPQLHKQAATVAAESADVRPAAPAPQSTAPTEAATAHSPAQPQQKPEPAEPDVPTPAQPAPGKPADVRPAPRTPRTTAASDGSHSTAPVPAVSPAPPVVPAPPVAPAQPTVPAPGHPAAAQPTTPASAQPAAATPAWGPGKSAFEPSASPGSTPDPSAPSSSPQTPAAPKAPETLTPAAHASPTANGTRHTSNTTQPADTPRSGSTPPSPGDPPPAWGGTSRTNRNDDRGSPDHDADVIDHPAAARPADDERRARHAAIATQPMNADRSEERVQRRARRAAPTHESARSIFDEVEERPRPDLRLASSNGRGRDADSSEAPGDGSPDREEFGGFFATGHQHLDTVTGLLDLPAGLNKHGRGASSDQDIGSRRNGRHRGE